MIFTIENCEDGTQNVKLTFEPGIAGENSKAFANMNDAERNLQGTGALVGSRVMEVLTSDG